MSRARAAVRQPQSPGEDIESAPRTALWRDSLFQRGRSFLANAFFEGLSAAGRMHPAAKPKNHGIELVSDVLYGHDDKWHKLDIYKPVTRPGPWPVVFYVHGGAFHLLSKDTHWLMGLVFARFGYLVVNISYRLAPKHPFPAAIEDTCRAYTWMASRLTELGGDPNRVVVAGESAGGNLISSLALAAISKRPEPWAREVFECGVVPRAVMPFCAMLQVSQADRFGKRRKMPWWIDGMIRDAGTSYLHGHPRTPSPTTALADPLLLVEHAVNLARDRETAFDLDSAPPSGAAARSGGAGPFDRPIPPFFVPVGTRDPLLDDTRRLEKALAALNVPCEARYYPGGIHAFHAMVWNPTARRCWRDALAFLDRHVR